MGVRRGLGYEPEQICADAAFWTNRIHPDDCARVLAEIRQLAADERRTLEYRFLHADGRWRWLRDELTLACGAGGEPFELIGSRLDVTERKEIEQSLREDASRMQALVDANPDLLFRIDRAGRYLDFHAGDETLLAARPNEIIGRNMADLFEADFANEARTLIDEALATGKPQTLEYQLPLQGEIRDFEARLVPSGPDEVISIVRDITDRARLEREVVAIGEFERRRIGRDLHDGLGQELTGISLGLRTLHHKLRRERSPLADTAEKLTGLVQQAIVDTQRIVRLLSPSISAERGLGAELSNLVRDVDEHTGVRCLAHCSGTADVFDREVATHLYRIAQESISNALKHSGATTIELTFRCDANSAMLEILDDGKGIPLDRDRPSGLGLKSMYYRARMLHGTLEISALAEGGTRVLCTCPLGRRRARSDEPEAAGF